MIALLMLGLVPGTNIQIDFVSWLRGIALLGVLVLLYAAHKKRLSAGLMIALIIYRAARRSSLSTARALVTGR